MLSSILSDTTQGGCTIWYDEGELWTMIQAKMGETVLPLDFETFKDPSQYGKKLVKPSKTAQRSKVDDLAETVAFLSHLETNTQHSYWRLVNWKRSKH